LPDYRWGGWCKFTSCSPKPFCVCSFPWFGLVGSPCRSPMDVITRQSSQRQVTVPFLNLSEQTIKNHIHRMLRKVGATDRLDLVKRCQSEQQALSASRPVAESEPPPAREVSTHSLIATLVPKRSRIERRQRGQMLSLPQAGSSSTGRCAKKVAAGSSVNA
jgi:hypothetical protein